jgi:hypothetical protein
MLVAKGKITQDMIMLLDKWRHTGFNVFFGPRILPRQEKSMITSGTLNTLPKPTFKKILNGKAGFLYPKSTISSRF